MRAYERVQAARRSTRPSGAFYIENIFDNFTELHGDRRFADDGAIIGGVATLNGKAVTVIAMERGDTIEERMSRSFGCPKPEGYRKALRLMKQAEKFQRPVICFVGSSGAYCGVDAEKRGQGQAIAENLMEMMTLKTQIVTVIIGEGGSGGALALSVADKIIMPENSVYSVISPEGCATILWKDSARAADAADVLRLTAADLKSFGIIDTLIDETNLSSEEICRKVKNEIVATIETNSRLSVDELLENRYNKYRNI